MKNVKGRNGGTIKQSEAGDPGNPGAGRPKGSISTSTKFKMFLESQEDYEVNGEKVKMSREEILMFRLYRMALANDSGKPGQPSSASITAIKELFDRAFGKPLQTNEITGKDGEPVQPNIITIRIPSQPMEDKIKLYCITNNNKKQ